MIVVGKVGGLVRYKVRMWGNQHSRWGFSDGDVGKSFCSDLRIEILLGLDLEFGKTRLLLG